MTNAKNAASVATALMLAMAGIVVATTPASAATGCVTGTEAETINYGQTNTTVNANTGATPTYGATSYPGGVPTKIGYYTPCPSSGKSGSRVNITYRYGTGGLWRVVGIDSQFYV